MLHDDEFEHTDPIAIPITDVLDLHSFAPRDARAAVEAYLDEVHHLGFEAIRIIHGKGIGAQREMVRKVLAGTSYVLHFSDAPMEAGSWGATIATLTKLDSPGG